MIDNYHVLVLELSLVYDLVKLIILQDIVTGETK